MEPKMKVPMKRPSKLLVVMLSIGAALGAGSSGLLAAQQQPGPPPQYGGPPPQGDGQPPSAPLPPDQLQQLVAPIALYPDKLVAQILAAAEYPTQIVEAERFLQDNPNLQGQDLGAQVDAQDWDPSVKALTQFPDVLSNMDKDLSWTSELGDANYNQPQDVMQAIQFMRQKAQAAGHLDSNPQEDVSDDGDYIDIAPVNPDIVYVPEYDPEMIYGYNVGLWPGFYPWWNIDGPYMAFGMGIGMSPFFGYGWGWGGWGMDWRDGDMMYDGDRYMSRGNAFYNRNAFMHGNYRGVGGFNRGDRGLRGFGGGGSGAGVGGRANGGSFARGTTGAGTAGGGLNGGGFTRGPTRAGSAGGGFNGGSFVRGTTGARAGGGGFNGGSFARGSTGARAGAFGSIRAGGMSRGFSSRGMSSMHGGFGGGGFGGGGFHGGGGGMRGGGGGRR